MGIARDEPQQLMYYRLEVQFFGRNKRKAVLQGESHLVAENAQCARARAVRFSFAVLDDII
jgi:hypothetical protein